MRGDFSAWNKDRSHNFRGTLHQQGRVLLDRDWNAQTEITGEWQEIAARDAFGAGVAAVPADEPLSFKVVKAEVAGGQVKVSINKGRVWADGLLVGLAEDAVHTATYLEPPIQDPAGKVSELPNELLHDAVILETWLEELSPFQDPDLLIEPALGGVDTTERVQTAFRFRLFRKADGDTCDSLIPKLKDDFSANGPKGKLTAELTPTVTIDGDCPVVESGGFTGFEHRLYRIEIADTKHPAPEAYFKWSHFNGGLVGTGDFDTVNHKVTIHGNRNAIVYSGLNSFYLEALEFDTAQGYWRVVYGARATLAADGTIDLQADAANVFKGKITNGKRFFRLWNGIERVANFTAKKDLPDNLGILIQFEKEGVGKYTPSDFWTFDVRAGGIGNPLVLIPTLPPQGILYHRVPLAQLHWKGNKITDDDIKDCRWPFQPLTKLKTCCTYRVGDGKATHGDFDSIEEAIDHLPELGGQICLLPGEHETKAVIKNKEDIRIVGCYQKTLVKPKEPETQKAIFTIQDSQFITFENMDLIHPGGIIFEMTGSEIGKLDEIDIHHTHMAAHIHGISIQQGQSIRIHDNTIGMFDKPQGDVAIFMQAEDSVIRDNIIRIITVEDIPLPEDDTDPSPPNWRHPCIELLLLLMNRSFIMQVLRFLWSNFFPTYQAQGIVYQTPGGIQIGCGSERIDILNNQIQGGWWNGITLGHLSEELKKLITKVRREYRNRELPPDLADKLEDQYLPLIYDLKIEGNEILNMGLNGIGVVDYFEARIGFLVSTENLMIYGNEIQYCLHQAQTQEEERFDLALGGIVLSDCEHLIIRENRIENNGNASTKPISGIYIHFGEKIDVSDNRIVNNGSRQTGQFNNPVANLKKDWFKPTESGLCAGVVVRIGFKRLIYEFIDQQEYIRPDGIPAVKIHDNIIVQPQGQALFIGAFGPVSVVGNTLTSQGANFNINPFSAVAGSVIILNLGISKDLIAKYMFGSPKFLARESYIVGKRKVPEQPSAIGWGFLPFLFCPSGNVLFSDNQVTLDLRSLEPNITLSSQLIFTLDDLAYIGNQSECTSFIDYVINNAVLFGATLRSVGNRFQEGVTITKNSMFSFGLLMNSCSSNQATHCLIAMPFSIPFPIPAHNMILHIAVCPALLKSVEGIVSNLK